MFHRSRNSGRELVGWNQLLCRSVLTPVSCTKFKIHSTYAESPRAETNFFSSLICKTSLCFTDHETQEENLVGGTSSFVGEFLHPSLVQSSRSIPRMQTVQGPKQTSSVLQFGGLVFVSQMQKFQEENLVGGTSSFVGQFLPPSLVQSSRSIPRMQTVQGPKQTSYFLQFGGPVFVSQIKKLRKRTCWVEPAPL